MFWADLSARKIIGQNTEISDSEHNNDRIESFFRMILKDIDLTMSFKN